MQSSGQAPQYGAQGEQPHSTQAPSPLLGPLRASPSTTGRLVLSKPFLTQPAGGFPIASKWQGTQFAKALQQSPRCSLRQRPSDVNLLDVLESNRDGQMDTEATQTP